ncbi:MAG: hypothetical protein GY851_09780 [bacterium]|nr:hypothetical protein [bacterium]
MLKHTGLALALALSALAPSASSQSADEKALATEVAAQGWIVYSARADSGSWDIFISRPDGSKRRNLSNTPDAEEVSPRFSPDGTRMLYRRMEKGSQIDHDRWGFVGEPVIANADGSSPQALGDAGDLPWASWSPDGKQVLCLSLKGIQIVDLATKKIVRTLPRKGIYQQVFWSPDGKWLCGTANNAGTRWTVVRMDVATGDLKPLRAFQNCTPDWFPDSRNVILSSRPAGQPGANGYGYTQLWMVDSETKDASLVYGEDGFHMYGAAVSPDGAYVVFTKGPKDGSGAKKDGAPIHVMRLSDAPSIGGDSPDLRKVHPDTKDGPTLRIGMGWEPCWTFVDVVKD